MKTSLQLTLHDLRSLPAFLTVEETAKLLRAGRNTVYELIRSNQINTIKLGTSYRVPTVDLLKMAGYPIEWLNVRTA